MDKFLCITRHMGEAKRAMAYPKPLAIVQIRPNYKVDLWFHWLAEVGDQARLAQ